MQARIVEPADLTPREIGLWREIQSASRHLASPFFAPEFTLAMGVVRPDARVAVLTVGGRTAGFLPYHETSPGVAKPIGGPISDFQGPVVAPDVPWTATGLLAACNLKAYDYNHAPATIAPLAAGAVHRAQSPHIDLAAGFRAYADGRAAASKDAIRSVERRRRKIEREIGPLRLEMRDGRAEAWDWLVAAKSAHYRRIGVASGFAVPWVARALDRLRCHATRDFAGMLHTLHAGDRLVAAQFGLGTPTTLAWCYTTYDEALRNYGPGTLLLMLAAERAAAEGITLIDLGRGDEPYKATYANGETPLCEGSIERALSVQGAIRRAQKVALRAAARVPLGRYESWPRRAMARLTTGMRLPAVPAVPSLPGG